jgi:Tol biopolymer transport system component
MRSDEQLPVSIDGSECPGREERYAPDKRPGQAAFPGSNGWIAFVSDRDTPVGAPLANDEIYVQKDGSSQAVRLTNDAPELTKEPATDTLPAVSPSGKEIVFTSDRSSPNPEGDAETNPEGDQEIYIMDANDDDGDGNGDNLRRLTDNGATESGPAWSPDGKKIVFASIADGDPDVYTMPADGSDPPTNLTNEAPGQRFTDNQARFSPFLSGGGTKIAFSSNRDGDFEVFTMNSDGSNPQQITSNTAITDSRPDYSPDGSSLAFASNRDGDFDVYTMKAAPESADNIPVNLTNAMSTNERFPAWSPDGTKIAFWSGIGGGLGPDAEIYTLRLDGSEPPNNLTRNDFGDITPDWGPAQQKNNRTERLATRT